MNARYCGASLTECMCKTWSSYSILLSSECDFISGHRISPKKVYTCTQELWVRPTIRHKTWCIKHAAHRLVQHMLQVVEMAWAGDSTLTIFFTCATGSLYCAVVLKRYDFNTGTVSQAAKTNSIDRLPCGYLYCCSHWIGKSLNGLHPCCRHRGDRLSIVHVFNSQVVFELMHDIKHASKSQKWLTALHMKIFNCAPASEIRWFKIFGKWFIQTSKHT